MLRALNKMLSGKTLFGIQREQYSEILTISDSVAAGVTKLTKVNVSFVGHFICTSITGRFSTLYLSGANILDCGVNFLSGQLLDGAGQRTLFSDYTPFDLFLSPGRYRRMTGLAGAAVANNLQAVGGVADKADNAPSLFFSYEFEYLFTTNSDIQLSVRNDSNTTNYFDIAFKGIRISPKG